MSPWIPAKSGGQCLKFYYTMYGKTMGSLSIKMEMSNGKSWYIFYESGDQGIDWKKGIGNIDVSLGLSYRVSDRFTFYFDSRTRYKQNKNPTSSLLSLPGAHLFFLMGTF